MRELSVNWHSGTLRPYQSMFSLGAQFCYLNSVSPRIFSEWLSESTSLAPKESDSRTLRCQPYLGIEKYGLKKLAYLLQEPIRVVRTLDIGPLLPKLTLDNNWEYPHFEIRVCSECIKLGYHATFHQLSWFGDCIIHKIPLQKIPYDLSRASTEPITVLRSLLFGKKSVWDFKNIKKWEEKIPNQHLKCVREYVNWIANANEDGWSTGGLCTNYVDLGRSSVSDLIHAICLIRDQRPGFYSCLTLSAITPITIRQCELPAPNISVSKEQLLTITKNEFENLVSLHQATIFDPPEIKKWEKYIYLTLRDIRRNHVQCVQIAQSLRNCQNTRLDFPLHRKMQQTCTRELLNYRFREWWLYALVKRRYPRQYVKFRKENIDFIGQSFATERWCFQNQMLHTYQMHDGRKRSVQISSWRLVSAIAVLADVITEQTVIASAWTLFNSRVTPPGRDFLDKSNYPLIVFREQEDDLTAYVCGRTSTSLPDWNAADAHPEHSEKIIAMSNRIRTIWEDRLFALSDAMNNVKI